MDRVVLVVLDGAGDVSRARVPRGEGVEAALVADEQCDDGNRRGRAFRGLRRWCAGGHDDVHARGDQLPGERVQPVELAIREAEVDNDISARYVSPLAEP